MDIIGSKIPVKPITIDYSECAIFKGARILFSHLEEGLECVRKQRIKDVCIWQDTDQTRYTVNLDFLKEMEFIETFDFNIKLSKKSNIEGLYSLNKLKKFGWAVGNHFDIDFSRLTTIESMNINYRDGLLNLGKLTKLKKLYVQSVKEDDLKFLSELENLELLRIIHGRFISLEGLESCKKLKELDLRRCFNLVHVAATLHKLSFLEYVALDSCRKHDVNIKEFESKISKIWSS